METLGNSPKTVMLYGPEVHKLHLEFEVAEASTTITFSADLVASDSLLYVIGTSGPVAVPYATSHDATMTAIADAIDNLAEVEEVTVSGRVITIKWSNDHAIPIFYFELTNGGLGTATVSATGYSADLGKIYKGMSVAITDTGKIRPANGADKAHAVIGISIHNATPGQLATVAMKGYAAVKALASGTVVPGPVKQVAVAISEGLCSYAVSSDIDYSVGLAISGGDNGDEITVVI
jgi:hypothetical protein